MNSLFVTEKMKFSFGLHFTSEYPNTNTRRYLFCRKRHVEVVDFSIFSIQKNQPSTVVRL